MGVYQLFYLPELDYFSAFHATRGRLACYEVDGFWLFWCFGSLPNLVVKFVTSAPPFHVGYVLFMGPVFEYFVTGVCRCHGF